MSLCLRALGRTEASLVCIDGGKGKEENEAGRSARAAAKLFKTVFSTGLIVLPHGADTYAFQSLRFFIARSSLLRETDCLPRAADSPPLFPFPPSQFPPANPQDRAHLTLSPSALAFITGKMVVSARRRGWAHSNQLCLKSRNNYKISGRYPITLTRGHSREF